MRRYILIFMTCLSLTVNSYGQSRISASLRSGYPFSPQEELLEGINSLGRPLNIAASADIQYAFIFPETSRLGRLYPTAYQGAGVSVFSLFDHQDIGTPVSIYVFQGARIARLSRSLSLDYEWNFGASFGWHRYKEHEFNTIMGTKVNAYVNGSLMLTWRAGEDWKIAVGPDMAHYSNGHTGLPNAGLNIIGMRLNVARTFGDEPSSDTAYGYRKESKWTKNISLDITAFGAMKKGMAEYNETLYLVDGMFGAAGLHITPFYDFNRHFRAGVSLDFNYDECANIQKHIAGVTSDDRIRFYRPPFTEQASVGLSARIEIVMPIFSVHFGIGHNIIYKSADLGKFYQIIALKIQITRRLYLHTGYQFRNFKYPDHLLIGFGWRFGNSHAVFR